MFDMKCGTIAVHEKGKKLKPMTRTTEKLKRFGRGKLQTNLFGCLDEYLPKVSLGPLIFLDSEFTAKVFDQIL